MKNRNSSTKNSLIWMSVLVLFVCVCCTTYVWADRMEGYLMDDTGAIALTPVNLTEDVLSTVSITDANTAAESKKVNYVQRTTTSLIQGGAEVSDDQVVWEMNTQVDIFKISYVNGESEITVNSDRGDKVIAPGTENSYTFKLKNTGNTSLDYTVTVEAYFTPDDVMIPVVARLNRKDGDWLVGSADEYVEVLSLNGAEDEGSLRAGRVASYTLDWKWPFETGQDEFDTYLGNRAVDEDLTLTIVIKTVAEQEAAANTGDDSTLGLWMGLTAASLILLIVLIILKKKSDKEKE